MDARKLTLGALFETSAKYSAPLYQRPYVWKEEENWTPLWEGVKAASEKRLEGSNGRPHFMGAIVLDQVKTPTGDVSERQMIDGQQRLTTLQLLLAAARDICQEHGLSTFREGFGRLTANYLPTSTHPDDLFKVWPTNLDRDHFRKVMTALTPEAIWEGYGLKPGAPQVGHLVPDCYFYFHRVLSSWLREPETRDARVQALWNALRQDLQIVVIDLDDHDDAQVIFETLNALGTPLLPADLVKNHLFHLAENQHDDTQVLYDRYWAPFDQETTFWRQEVRQGRLRRPRIDLFLQHYLSLATTDEVLVTQLFRTFRNYVLAADSISAADHLALLAEYGAIFKSFNERPEMSPEWSFFRRLDQLETSTFFPLLLEVFRRHGSETGAGGVEATLKDL